MLRKKIDIFLGLIFALVLFTQSSTAKSADEIDKEIVAAIDKFKQEIQGGDRFLSKVKGYLVFPSVIRGGVVVGGKYAEGAMIIDGKTKFYLSMRSASIGLQVGMQEYSMLIAFITDRSLKNFYKSNGWEAGVDGTITLAQWGASRDISSISFEQPVVAFVYNEKGLMAGISISGTKFEHIEP